MPVFQQGIFYLPAAASSVFKELIDEFRPVLGDELRAVYATGSAAMGDFVPGASDIDGIVFLHQGWRERCDLQEIDHRWSRFVDRYRDTLLRILFISLDELEPQLSLVNIKSWLTHGILISGENIKNEFPTPTLEMLRLDEILSFTGRYLSLKEKLPYSWNPDDLNYYLRYPAELVLWITTPAKMLYTWYEGSTISKTRAVRWYEERYPGLISCWMQETLDWRMRRFPDKERIVPAWCREVPDLTIRLAYCLNDLIDGIESGLDHPVRGHTLDSLMRSLARKAGEWLDYMPFMEWRRSCVQWANDPSPDLE